uniref:N-acetyltransferase domain-containing protein n=1 Tax=uncultured Micrococcales bacterium TaxID=1920814 RepID=A0A871YC87_9MICO|nr:hypothetical protein HULAa2F4_00013 [uncultured Micrococcales bacterium]
MKQIELVELSGKARDFLHLETASDQIGLVATVAQSYADALYPDAGVVPWLRGLTVDGKPAGMLMCSEPTQENPDPWLWRLLVDKDYQRLGVGRFAVEQVIARYRARGCSKLLVSWQPKPNNPGDFYKKLGFVETGELNDGEIVAACLLNS